MNHDLRFPTSFDDLREVLGNTRIVIAVLFALGGVVFLLLFLDSHYKNLAHFAANENRQTS